MLAKRIAAVPVVIVALLGGVYVTGGLVTNEFRVAMILTIAWMAAAGLACLIVALRRRDLRWPVIGAYLVTAAAAGIYLGRAELFDDEVHERVAVAAPAPAKAAPAHRAARVNVRLARGTFEGVRHPGRGTATAIGLAHGGRVLTLTRLHVN